jgi:membrane protease YdiL (CAAX protease family)
VVLLGSKADFLAGMWQVHTSVGAGFYYFFIIYNFKIYLFIYLIIILIIVKSSFHPPKKLFENFQILRNLIERI